MLVSLLLFLCSLVNLKKQNKTKQKNATDGIINNYQHKYFIVCVHYSLMKNFCALTCDDGCCVNVYVGEIKISGNFGAIHFEIQQQQYALLHSGFHYITKVRVWVTFSRENSIQTVISFSYLL